MYLWNLCGICWGKGGCKIRITIPAQIPERQRFLNFLVFLFWSDPPYLTRVWMVLSKTGSIFEGGT